MNEQQSKNSGPASLFNHLGTPEEIARFAYDGNHVILYLCVKRWRAGIYTWEQAMQVAAFTQAETIATLQKELVRMINRVPAEPAIDAPKG